MNQLITFLGGIIIVYGLVLFLSLKKPKSKSKSRYAYDLTVFLTKNDEWMKLETRHYYKPQNGRFIVETEIPIVDISDGEKLIIELEIK